MSAWCKGLPVHMTAADDKEPSLPEEQVISGKRHQGSAVPSIPIQFEYNAADFPPLPSPVPADVSLPVLNVPELPPVQSQVQDENAHRMVTRAKDGIRKPNPRYILHTVKGIPSEPKSIAEALSHPGWNGSMGEEIDTCDETKTWSLVPRPPDTHVLGCRWVHKVKLNADGTVQKLRSRLVAK